MFIINYFKCFSPLYRPKTDLNLISLLIFSLSFINIFSNLTSTNEGLVSNENLSNPIWLLFGPLLFFAYKAILNKKFKLTQKSILHFLPFCMMSLFYTFVILNTDTRNPWQNEFYTFYQNSYIVIAASLGGYSIVVLTKMLNIDLNVGHNAVSLLIALAATYILICLVLFMILIGWLIDPIDMGFDYRLLTYSLLFFINICICYFWFFNANNVKENDINDVEINTKIYKNSPLTDELAFDYKDRITNYFENQSVYLDSKLSVDTLAKELAIPKHYFSQLFNVYFEKSFHSFVAEYRILYAIELVNVNNGRLKIESLAHSCGFSSKTSLNKYFKEITGFTPSEYLLRLNKQSA